MLTHCKGTGEDQINCSDRKTCGHKLKVPGNLHGDKYLGVICQILTNHKSRITVSSCLQSGSSVSSMTLWGVVFSIFGQTPPAWHGPWCYLRLTKAPFLLLFFVFVCSTDQEEKTKLHRKIMFSTLTFYRVRTFSIWKEAINSKSLINKLMPTAGILNSNKTNIPLVSPLLEKGK